jgi:glutamate racemase
LTILRAVRELIPCHPLIYLADQVHVPYGERTLTEVRQYTEQAARFLLAHQAELIVIACNTASAAALHYLRTKFPDVPFVGMEPAVKPAASNTHSGVIGVLATPVTFQGELYASVVSRFAHGVTILQDTCPGLVARIEAGDLTSQETRAILEGALDPMLEKNVDEIVMGCTHYPFVIPLIQEIVGPNVSVIDPAPAVARQTARLLSEQKKLVNSCMERAKVSFYTTGDSTTLSEMLPRLIGEEHVVQYIQQDFGLLR